VLINRFHKFTDLVCTVDSFEDRLLGAIDGNRTLAEILQFTAQDGDGNPRASRFFERLWQYDQVVFDASRASAEPSGPLEGETMNSAGYGAVPYPAKLSTERSWYPSPSLA